jgi:hypothetical protein
MERLGFSFRLEYQIHCVRPQNTVENEECFHRGGAAKNDARLEVRSEGW